MELRRTGPENYGAVLAAWTIAIAIANLGLARAANEVIVYGERGGAKAYHADSLATALDEVKDNDRIVLEPGIDYTLDGYTLTGGNGVAIEGGQQDTIHVLAGGVLEYTSRFNELGFSSGARVWFSGDVPRELNAGELYSVLAVRHDVNHFTIAESLGSKQIRVSRPPHGNPCYVHWTANIQCSRTDSAATPYNYMLYLAHCDNCTVRNVRFDGRGLANERGHGKGLQLYKCEGTVFLDGVCVSRTRGAEEDNGDSGNDFIHYRAYGIVVNACETVNILRCAGHENGNATLLLTNNKQTVNVEDFAVSRSVNRDIQTSGTTMFESVAAMRFARCYLYNNDNAMGQPGLPYTNATQQPTEVPRLSVNLNFKGTRRFPRVEFEDLFIDWRGLNDRNSTWNQSIPQTTPLFKAQNIRTLTFKDSEFLHDGNAYRGGFAAPSFRIDAEPNIRGIRDISFSDCHLSGGIWIADQPSNDLNSFRFVGGSILRDGRFNLPCAVQGVEYPTFTLAGNENGMLEINNVGGGGYVVLMNHSNVATTSDTWSFDRLSVSLDPRLAANANMLFIKRWPPVTATPSKAEVGWRNNAVQRPKDGSFRFSTDDGSVVSSR